MQRLGRRDRADEEDLGVGLRMDEPSRAGIWVQRKEGCVGMKREEMHL